LKNSWESKDLLYTSSKNETEFFLSHLPLAMGLKLKNRHETLLNGPHFEGTFLSLRCATHPHYQNTLDQLARIIDYASHHAIKNIVHLGIGGSQLGPQLLYDVCASYLTPAYHCYFFSSFDSQLESCLRDIHFDETLFLVVSKSFTTDEVLWQWDLVKSYAKAHQKTLHSFALTSQIEKAKRCAFASDQILFIPHEAGGRFSVWSVVSAIIATAFGLTVFSDFLAGARAMDEALGLCDDAHNPARQMAIEAAYASMKDHKQSRAILPYHAQLEKLVPYLQQLEMESLGKQIDRDGKLVPLWVAPVIWGGVGTCLQHSVFQSILQGGLALPMDFITVKGQDASLIKYRDHLHAQISILKHGYESSCVDEKIAPNANFQIIELEGLSARTLGSLIALYEHKVLWMASLLNMDPFTQPGVQAAKTQLKISVQIT
jgi:glucose-6-phosphate isomerase